MQLKKMLAGLLLLLTLATPTADAMDFTRNSYVSVRSVEQVGVAPDEAVLNINYSTTNNNRHVKPLIEDDHERNSIPIAIESSDSQDWDRINSWFLMRLSPENRINDDLDFTKLKADRQQFLCLALNVYFEARGSTDSDQYGVAHVTVNRTRNALWQGSICDVVWERYQFSWTLDIARVTDLRAWEHVQEIAYNVLSGNHVDITGGCTHFYNPRVVRPTWSSRAIHSVRLGAHRYLRVSQPRHDIYVPERVYARSISRVIMRDDSDS